MKFNFVQQIIDIIRMKNGILSHGILKRVAFSIANLLRYDDEKSNCLIVNFIYRLTGMHIGKNVYISRGFDVWGPWNITLEDNVDIGQNCSVQAFSKVKFEKYVHTAKDLSIVAGSHNNSDFGPLETTQDVVIGAGTWIGTRVTVLGGVKIGKGCIIGAGSLVNKDIPNFSIAVGVPCKVIKKRIPAETIIHPSGNYNIKEILN